MSTSARYHLFKTAALLLLVTACLALGSRIALASEPPLWQWVDAQVVTNSTGSAQKDSSEEVLARLASRLKKTSPNGLPSLRYFSFNREQLTSLRNGNTIDVAAPTAAFSQVTLKSLSENSLGVETLRAKQTTGDATMSMSQKGDAISGTLIQNGQRWKFTVRGGLGIMYLDSELRSIGGKHGEKDDAIEPPAKKNLAGVTSPTSGQVTTNELGDTEIVEADLLITYTPAAYDLYGDEAGIATRISDIVDATNKAYEDSNVYLRVNLLEAIEADFDPDNELMSGEALDALTGFGNSAAELEHLRSQTDRIGADFLVMFRPFVSGDNACGIAWLGGGNDSEYSSYFMVSHTSFDCSDVVNAHELGHNMGLSHSRRQSDQGHVFPYALGHGVDNEFATIMAYPQEFSASRLPYFSSPELDCNGLPCGVDHTDPEEGADSVRALNLRRAQISTIRDQQSVSGELLVMSSVGPGQINYQESFCSEGLVCEVEVSSGTELALQAEPGADARFTGWGGSCSGTETTCSLTVSELTNVIAYFEEDYLDIPIGQALDNTELTFETTNAAPWRAQDTEVSRGDSAMRSATIDNYGSTEISTVVSGYGELNFAAKVSSEESYDKLVVRVNGQAVLELSGEKDWQEYSVAVTDTQQAENFISFSYEKDGGTATGDDRAWLDNVQFEPNGEGPQRLRVTVLGDGYVGGNEFSGVCETHCELNFEKGTELTLSTTSTGSSPFVGWGSSCRGDEDSCQLVMDREHHVYAFFIDSTVKNFNEALDNEALYFSSVQNPWEVTEATSTANGSALQSGEIGDRQSSSIYTTVVGPGDLTYDWKVSSERSYDHLWIYINGSKDSAISGEQDWTTTTVSLPEGTHDIRWSYEKDGSVSYGDDRGYLDSVRWTGDAAQWNKLLLSTSGNNGAIRSAGGIYCRSECEVSFLGEQSYRFYAEPNINAEFVRWEGACNGSDPVCELGGDESFSLHAVFSVPTYTVTASASDGGVVSPEQQQVTEGASAEVTATPLSGYSLSSIAGCNGTIDGDGRTYVTAPVYSNCTVNAEFAANLYQVTFDLGDYGTYTGGGNLEQLVRWGEAAEAPLFDVAAGWHFAGWSNDFSKVTENIDVAASYQFIEGSNEVAIEIGNGGRMNLQPTQYIPDGGYVEVLLTPEPGFRVRQKAAGTCPEGEWSDNRYRTGLINDSCSLSLGFSPVLKSGSLLLILSGQEDDEEDQQ